MKQTLVVTGGARGIGGEIALAAGRTGVPVAVLYRSSAESAADVVARIEAAGGRAMALAADIGREEDVVTAFEAVDAELGPIGGLVNNAVQAPTPRRLVDLPLAELEDVFRTNVIGTFLCTREAARRLSTSHGGSGGAIVTMSSVVAVKTGAPGHYVHFSATKGAVETMSLGVARELAAEGVRVNVVRCGVIATETRMSQPEDYLARARASVPMGRMGEPAEVARAVLWLLSPDASYVTGATLDVAGGM